MDSKFKLLIGALIILSGILFYLLLRAKQKQRSIEREPIKTFEQKEIEFNAVLRHEYSSALQSGDTEQALALGKKYYQTLRGGELTIDDEQTIANDMSTMKKL